MRYRSSRSQRLGAHFLDVGDWKSPAAIVALHSVGSDLRQWSGQFESFASVGQRLLVPDSDGHGQSPWSRATSVEHWVDALDDVLLTAGVEVADVVGLSMGGFQAIAFAARRPGRVRRLVLADTFAGFDAEAATERRARLAGRARTLGMPAYADAYAEETLFGADQDSKAMLRDAIARMSVEAFSDSVAALFGTDLRTELPRIECPTLVLRGDDDQKAGMESSQEILEHVGSSRFASIPGAGHLSNLDRPTEFLSVVVDFLKEPLPALP